MAHNLSLCRIAVFSMLAYVPFLVLGCGDSEEEKPESANVKPVKRARELKFYSDQPETTVRINGNRVGVTPSDSDDPLVVEEFTAGEHKVEFHKKGFETYSKQVTLKADAEISVKGILPMKRREIVFHGTPKVIEAMFTFKLKDVATDKYHPQATSGNPLRLDTKITIWPDRKYLCTPSAAKAAYDDQDDWEFSVSPGDKTAVISLSMDDKDLKHTLSE